MNNSVCDLINIVFLITSIFLKLLKILKGRY